VTATGDGTAAGCDARPVGLGGDHAPPPALVLPVARRLAAEFTGTAFLVAGVVGSGIMAERLTDDAGRSSCRTRLPPLGSWWR
jgi:hypothetical protein